MSNAEQVWWLLAGVHLFTVIYGFSVGSEKGRPWAGTLMTLFYSVPGMLVVACMPTVKWEGNRIERQADKTNEHLAEIAKRLAAIETRAARIMDAE